MAGLILVLATAPALAGCAGTASRTTASGSPSASPSPLSPKDALAASFKQLGQTSYSAAVKDGDTTGEATVDSGHQSARVSITMATSGVSIKLGTTAVGSDVWVTMDMGPQLNSQFGLDPKKWMHVDKTKLKGDQAKQFDFTPSDPLDVDGLLDAVVDVKRTDSQHYSGTLDMTKATGSSKPADDVLTKAGDKAKSVPFSATLDDQGRLLSFKVDGAAIDPSLAHEVTISGYGTQSVTAPNPADVIEMPAKVYDLLNG